MLELIRKLVKDDKAFLLLEDVIKNEKCDVRINTNIKNDPLIKICYEFVLKSESFSNKDYVSLVLNHPYSNKQIQIIVVEEGTYIINRFCNFSDITSIRRFVLSLIVKHNNDLLDELERKNDILLSIMGKAKLP